MVNINSIEGIESLIDKRIKPLKEEILKLRFELEELNKALSIPVVVKSLPQDNFCEICNLPTDGEKCYSKRCPI